MPSFSFFQESLRFRFSKKIRMKENITRLDKSILDLKQMLKNSVFGKLYSPNSRNEQFISASFYVNIDRYGFYCKNLGLASNFSESCRQAEIGMGRDCQSQGFCPRTVPAIFVLVQSIPRILIKTTKSCCLRLVLRDIHLFAKIMSKIVFIKY